MIKQIWTIQNPQKLFKGLAAAVTAVFVTYSALSVCYLPDTVTIRFFGEGSRFFLLVLPVVMILVCALWFYLVKRGGVLVGMRPADDPVQLSRQKKLSEDCRIASMMFWSVGLGFLQLDFLNTAKKMQGFGLFVPIACLIAMAVVSVRYRLKIRKLAGRVV